MTEKEPLSQTPEEEKLKRFDQRRDVFQRAEYDPQVIAWKEKFYSRKQPKTGPGYEEAFRVLTQASWFLEDEFAMGNLGSNQAGLYAWKTEVSQGQAAPREHENDPQRLTGLVKKTAGFFGAALVGVCELNPLWVYSFGVNNLSGEHHILEIPETYRFAVVMAIEMDYEMIHTSPSRISSAATGLGYSRMAFTAGLLARFIRGLGYGAIPCGNDTALSIPLAVDAGLGELGRNGLLITEKYGPRVRLCKVFTDMPLISDKPKNFGVEAFCQVCKKCADHCPSRAIPFGEKSAEVPTISNNPGVKKWTINPEHCYRFWGANQTDCSNCIRVCPFNQKPGWLHDLVRLLIRFAPWLNPFLVSMHGLLGYDRQDLPASEWEN